MISFNGPEYEYLKKKKKLGSLTPQELRRYEQLLAVLTGTKPEEESMKDALTRMRQRT